MNTEQPEPFLNVNFRIEIEGLQGTGATEVIFPEARIIERDEHQRLIQYGHLTLRRGMTRSSEWYQWWDRARASADTNGRNVTIVLADRVHADVLRWSFANAMPAAYLVSPLRALGGEPLIETLELSVAGVKMTFGRP